MRRNLGTPKSGTLRGGQFWHLRIYNLIWLIVYWLMVPLLPVFSLLISLPSSLSKKNIKQWTHCKSNIGFFFYLLNSNDFGTIKNWPWIDVSFNKARGTRDDKKGPPVQEERWMITKIQKRKMIFSFSFNLFNCFCFLGLNSSEIIKLSFVCEEWMQEVGMCM